jgi:hypothetical protein
MFRPLHEYDSSLIFSRIHSTWQTSQSNIDRTGAIMKKLASQFAGNTGVVPVIAPLNEWVFPKCESSQNRSDMFYIKASWVF